ncbi:hypothetical protein Tco_0013517 [Tanacetum coccineum]
MVPRRILTRSDLISLNTARQSHFNAVRTNRVNAVKASACWVWRPIKPNSASITLKIYDYVDVRGRFSKFLSLEALFEGRPIMSICSQVWMEGYDISKVGDDAVHKELGDRMERAATTTSSFEAEQDNGLRLHLNSPMIYLSQEVTHLEVGRTIKAAKPKVITTAATTTTTTRPKAKGVVVQEPKEQKLARKQEEEEANIALIESWETTQAIMKADRLLAERLQSKEREELTNEEKGKLFMELMEKRRKHFAALRA